MLTKFHLVKAMVFMYRCECWTIKKTKCQRTDAFELWCYRRSLGVSWRSNQSVLKEIIPEYSLEGLMLKLQYFGYVMQRIDSLEKTLMLRKIEDTRRRGRQDEMVGWHHRFSRHESEHAPRDSKGWGSLVYCSP